MSSSKISIALAAILFLYSAVSCAATPIDNIVAIVNGDVVMSSELDRHIERIRQELDQRGTDSPPPGVFERQVLERLIIQKIQLQLAKQAGIKVNDNALNQAIANIATQNELTTEKFRTILEKEGHDFQRFRRDIRDEILITKLRQRQIDSRIQVSDIEVDSYLTAQAQRGGNGKEFRISHILIAVSEDSSKKEIEAAREKASDVLEELRTGADFRQTAVTVSEGRQALEGGDLGWLEPGQLPTLFADLVIDMEEGDISDLIQSPSGFHIIKLMESHQDEKHMIRQTNARHILIRVDELVSDSEAQARLTQLKLRIEGGEDFSELARSHSDDSASAVKGGDLGWVNPGDLVPVFEQAMDELEPGQLSNLFKTQFGWHIVQVQERRDYDGTGEVQRAQAKQAIRKRKVEEEHQIWLRQLRDEAYVEYRLGNNLSDLR